MVQRATLNNLSLKRVPRFIIVGIANATISFGVLDISFYVFHESKIVSNIIGTLCAITFSFIMNRIFVFRDRSKNVRKQFIAFMLVTLSGSLVILNLAYTLSVKLLKGHEYLIIKIAKEVIGIKLSTSFVDINLSLVIGSFIALFWNYNGYRMFVFKGSVENAIEEAIENTP